LSPNSLARGLPSRSVVGRSVPGVGRLHPGNHPRRISQTFAELCEKGSSQRPQAGPCWARRPLRCVARCPQSKQ
jgi:hypothetical protein